MAIRIDRVDAGSEAEALGLAGGDELLSVDGNELNDTLDYDFYTDSKSFHLKARVADGIREWDVRREERGPFGCDFSTYLGDQKHSCSNHCMFTRSTASSRCTSRPSTSRSTPPIPSSACGCWRINGAARC